MSVILDGTNGVSTPNTFAFKNRIIDGGFIINQRGYVSNTALSSGSYAHDRWKAGSGGCTYTFTQGSLGVNTTITITAGTLVQVIEGCNLAEGGTYVLSWTGTAQGRLNGGTYGSSGSVVISGWTAGTNLNVEFNTGTLGSVQLEKGSTATSFDYRPYGTELQLCQRYYFKNKADSTNSTFGSGFNDTTTTAFSVLAFPVSMRIAPAALEQSGTASHYRIRTSGEVNTTCNSVPAYVGSTNESAWTAFTVASGLTSGQGIIARANNAAAFLAWSAEL